MAADKILGRKAFIPYAKHPRAPKPITWPLIKFMARLARKRIPVIQPTDRRTWAFLEQSVK